MLWGIDLGGTKIEGVILPPGSVDPIVRLRVPTEQEKGYLHIVGQIAGLVATMESRSGMRRPDRVGMGTPGAFDPHTRMMKNCNTTCLNGTDLPGDTSRALGCHVEVANDANCFALAEALLGAARGYRTVFGIILGTGVGGGIVVDGKVLSGCHGIAGEWGHNVLVPDGPACYCGKRGCVEAVISGPALSRMYRDLSGRPVPFHNVPELAEQGDKAARVTLDWLCRFFGKATANVINILDPDAIVVGGGVGNVPELYTEGRAAIMEWLFNPRLDTPILRPLLGDSAGVFGAAMLVQ